MPGYRIKLWRQGRWAIASHAGEQSRIGDAQEADFLSLGAGAWYGALAYGNLGAWLVARGVLGVRRRPLDRLVATTVAPASGPRASYRDRSHANGWNGGLRFGESYPGFHLEEFTSISP